ncbi:hypothetical protein SCLCIDRAFT_1066085 [Scleroderma citrinum Foug A]|uniref:Nucleolar protein 9 n=1 Tax=Scleroderma citrinum Foug A TaxID=1036808 RepID=A0A0C3E4J3_9AGAM|nr:hypothetical protein SCLCIDRAFT_1066085 [Scleroderma citrinum Foug A]
MSKEIRNRGKKHNNLSRKNNNQRILQWTRTKNHLKDLPGSSQRAEQRTQKHPSDMLTQTSRRISEPSMTKFGHGKRKNTYRTRRMQIWIQTRLAAKRLFFVVTLNEMAGKEKQLATDPECSFVLERMFYSMDDFPHRFDSLINHRFASHVCQTFFSVAAETVAREVRSSLIYVPNLTAPPGRQRVFYQKSLSPRTKAYFEP